MSVKLRLYLPLFVLSLALVSCNLPLPVSGQPGIPPTVDSTPAPSPLPATPELSPTPTVVQGTLVIWHAWDEGDRPALAAIIDAFSQVYPNVYFDVLYIPASDLPKRYLQAVREGNGPTLLLGPAEWGAELFAEGALADLGAYASADLLELVNPTALPTGFVHDTLVSLPYAQQGVVLYRNADISTIAPETFDELILLAQSATQGETIGAILERGFDYSGGHLLGLGGELMDGNSAPLFSSATGVAWLELLKAFEQAGPVNYLTDQDLDLFKQGKVGWIIDGTWNLLELAGAIGADRLAIDPWPRYLEGRLAGFLTTEAFYLNPRTGGEQLSAALAFVTFFLNETSQAQITQTERIPAAIKIEAGPTITDTLFTQAMIALQGDVAYPVTPALEVYKINLDQALQAFFSSSLSAAESLRVAAEAIQAAWQERLALTPAPTTPTPSP